MELRPHQIKILDDLRKAFVSGHRCVMVGLPTGGGKTHIAAAICAGAKDKGHRTLFICHLNQIVRQTVARFEEVGLKVGVLQGQNTRFSRDDDVIVASIHTIARRRAPDWVRSWEKWT